jgi:hypothetical protein
MNLSIFQEFVTFICDLWFCSFLVIDVFHQYNVSCALLAGWKFEMLLTVFQVEIMRQTSNLGYSANP